MSTCTDSLTTRGPPTHALTQHMQGLVSTITMLLALGLYVISALANGAWPALLDAITVLGDIASCNIERKRLRSVMILT